MIFYKAELLNLSEIQWFALTEAIKASGKKKIELWGREGFHYAEWVFFSSLLKSAKINSLDLIETDFSTFDANQCKDFVSILEDTELKEISMRLRMEHQYQYDMLNKILQSAKINSFSSYGNNINLSRDDQWTWLCHMLAKVKLDSFSLSSENYQEIPQGRFEMLFGALKSAGVTKLGFTDVSTELFGREQWIWFGKQLKEAGIQQFNLSNNEILLYFKENHWEAFTKAIQFSQIKSLNLSENYNWTLEDLNNRLDGLFDMIANCELEEINLSGNYLDHMTSNNWDKLGESLKKSGVTSLILDYNVITQRNEHDKKDKNEIILGLGRLLKVAGIKSLSLKSCIHYLHPDLWFLFCQQIWQSKLTSINLDKCTLMKKQEHDIDWIMKQKNNRSLKLSCTNRLWQLPSAKLEGQIFSITDPTESVSLPNDIKKLMLDDPSSQFGPKI